MAMLNNQRVYPVYDRFKRNNDDTPMSLKLEPSSSEINAVHDSKNIAWLAGKKNRKWCANVFSPRSKPAAQDRLHPHRPCIQTAGIYLPFRGDDHGLSHSNLHLYWTNCHHYRMFFFSRCPASDVSWSINIFNYEYINIYHKANRYWNELWVPSVVCL